MTTAGFVTDIAIWCLAEWLHTQLTQLNNQLAQLNAKVDKMAQVAVDQTDLDNLASQLEAVKTSLATEISNLQAAAGATLPPGSLDGLNSALTDLQSLETPAATPAPPPAAPADTTTAPVDAGGGTTPPA